MHEIPEPMSAREWNRLLREARGDRYKKYGLTREQYNKLHNDQGGACAICGSVPEPGPLCIDHCHTSGKVRGLLCSRCNAALGLLKDSRKTLLRAVRYIERNEINLRTR